MSVWLNTQAVKLQNTEEMRNAIVVELERDRESFESLTSSISITDAVRIVQEVKAQNRVAPAPLHETLVMANVLAWFIVIAIISYGSALTDRTKEVVVGVAVNLNFVIFCGSPLSAIWTILNTRCAATIHAPLMLTQVLNGTFWAAYGIALYDPVIIVPNSIGAGLGVVQIILCVLFPRNKQESETGECTEVSLRTNRVSPATDEQG